MRGLEEIGQKGRRSGIANLMLGAFGLGVQRNTRGYISLPVKPSGKKRFQTVVVKGRAMLKTVAGMS